MIYNCRCEHVVNPSPIEIYVTIGLAIPVSENEIYVTIVLAIFLLENYTWPLTRKIQWG